MTVVVEGRKPQCWNCKQLGHFSKSCPQKTNQTQAVTATTATIAATVTKEKTTTTESEGPHSETGGHPDKEEGWTQVQRGKKKKNPMTTNTTTSTIAVTTMAATTSTTKEHQAASSATGKQPATTKQQPAKQLPESSSAAATTKKSQGKEKERNNKETECMEVSVNLKRRRDSGDSQKDGGEKKHIKKPPQDTKIHSQTPSQSQPKGEENITKSPERPAQLIPLPQQTKNTLTDDFPLSLK